MRKGISPLVATVLLVSITIVVAAVVASWANFYVKGSTDDINKKNEAAKVCDGGNLQNEASFNSYNSPKLVIAIKNVGTVPIGSFSFIIKDATETKVHAVTNGNTTIQPGGFILLEASDVTVKPQLIDVTTNCANVDLKVSMP